MSISTAHSVVEPSRLTRTVAGTLVIVYALVTMVPLAWIFLTGFKTPPDSISIRRRSSSSPRWRAM